MTTQTFLVGPSIYLRGVEREDAAFESVWNPRPWPRDPETAFEKIAEEQMESADDQRRVLLACRKHDNVIVGSLTVSTYDGQILTTETHVSPLANSDVREGIEAEVLQLALPWLTSEQGAMAVLADVVSGRNVVQEAIEAIGARQCFRLREANLIEGSRADLLGYQYFNPIALERFGEPVFIPEEEQRRTVRAPAPPRWPVVDRPPAGAVAIGERVYLRAVCQDDAAVFSQSALEETETSHDTRWPRSGLVTTSRLRRTGETASPQHASFAIVLRANDQMIGRNELQYIDLFNRTAETATEILRPEFRSKGYGTEAKHLLLWYAFNRIGLHMVRSTVWEINQRSAAALKKQGYRQAGSIPWLGLHNGAPTGDLMFDLLAAEWRSARR